MSNHIHVQTVPRGALVGAAVLILCTLALAAGSRHSQASSATVVAPPRESVQVRFEDRPDGTLAMIDAVTGREVTTVPPGTNGFIRGVLRGMFRGRKLEALGHDATFTLSRGADGRLTLDDPQIGRHVDLDSFGPTNASAFAGLLSAAVQAR